MKGECFHCKHYEAFRDGKGRRRRHRDGYCRFPLPAVLDTFFVLNDSARRRDPYCTGCYTWEKR